MQLEKIKNIFSWWTISLNQDLKYHPNISNKTQTRTTVVVTSSVNFQHLQLIYKTHQSSFIWDQIGYWKGELVRWITQFLFSYFSCDCNCSSCVLLVLYLYSHFVFVIVVLWGNSRNSCFVSYYPEWYPCNTAKPKPLLPDMLLQTHTRGEGNLPQGIPVSLCSQQEKHNVL